MKRIGACVIACVLAGCAGISVQHLTPDGTGVSGVDGIRYYLPKPYLLVTLLPPDSQTASTGQGASGVPQVGTPPARGRNSPPRAPTAPAAPAAHVAPAAPNHNAGQPLPNAGGAQHNQNQSQNQNQANNHGQSGQQNSGQMAVGTTNGTAVGAPTTNTSFVAVTSQYIVKLIYLPDYSNPMVIKITAGLIGSITAQPTLQDGWMLTGFQGSADNSQLPQVLGTLVSSLAGGSSKAASGGATAALPKAGGGNTEGGTASSILTDQMLEPGLFSFHYDDVTKALTDVCLVRRFGPAPASPAIPDCKSLAATNNPSH